MAQAVHETVYDREMQNRLWIACLLLAGCAHLAGRSPTKLESDVVAPRAADAKVVRRVEPPMDPRMRTIVLHHGAHLVAPVCEGGLPGPSSQEMELSGIAVSQPCGLVAEDMDGPDAYARFALAHCGGEEEGACQSRYRSMFVARALERYPLADAEWISNHCVAYPDECATFSMLERTFLESHNAQVRVALERDMTALRTQVAQERAARHSELHAKHLRQVEEQRRQAEERSERRRAKFRAVGQALEEAAEEQRRVAGQGTHCRSRAVGSTVYTDCD